MFLTIVRHPAASLWLRAPAVLTVAWAVVIALVTLRPDPAAAEAVARSPWWCVSCGEAGTADLLLNLALFFPLGWGLSRSGAGLRWALSLAMAMTILIEVTQGMALPGRDAALGDVLANTAGAAAGHLAAAGLARKRPPWLGWVALAVFATQLLVAWWFWGPAPATAMRALRVAPELVGRPVYHGEVAAFSHGGDVILGEDRPLPAATALAATFTWSADGNAHSTAVLRLEDGRGWPVASVSLQRERAALSVRTIAGALQFRDPGWTISPDGIREGEPVEVTLRLQRGVARVGAMWDGGASERVVRQGPQHGWVFLNPYAPAVGDPGWHGWTLAWLAGWGILLGWAARGRRPLVVGIAALGAFMLACVAAGAPASVAELLALAVGELVGFSSARSRRPLAAA